MEQANRREQDDFENQVGQNVSYHHVKRGYPYPMRRPPRETEDAPLSYFLVAHPEQEVSSFACKCWLGRATLPRNLNPSTTAVGIASKRDSWPPRPAYSGSPRYSSSRFTSLLKRLPSSTSPASPP